MAHLTIIRIQDRDAALLQGLFDSRVMTTAHICALYFDGHAEMTKKRLQLLASAKFIRKKRPALFQRATISLALAGVDELRRRGRLHGYPQFHEAFMSRRLDVSPLNLAHELEVMDVKTSFVAAAESKSLHVAEFSTWPLLNQFSVRSRGKKGSEVRPDGFTRIVSTRTPPQNGTFFVELDRSTEKLSILTERAGQYLAHGRSSPRGPFRALFVLKTAERRNNVAESLLRRMPPVLTQVWLATLPEVLADPFGPIWIRPVDYRDAVAGSEFAIVPEVQPSPYKRRTARDEFVDRWVPKRPLFDNLSDGEA